MNNKADKCARNVNERGGAFYNVVEFIHGMVIRISRPE